MGFRRRVRLLALCVGLGFAGAALISFGAGAQASVVAHKSSICSISKVWHSLGPTYVTGLAVTDTTCADGETVIRAYNHCRLKSGGLKGRCRTRVDDFTCTEQRYLSPDQFIGKVACTTSREVAVHFTYSEDF